MSPDERAMLEEMHSFWFKSQPGSPPNQPTRAAQFDTMFGYWRTGRLVIKVMIWIGASAVAISAGVSQIGHAISALFKASGGGG